MTPKCPDCKRDQDDCVCSSRLNQVVIDQIVRQQEEIMELRRRLDEKQRIKHPEPAYQPFWAVSVHSESWIAHLVEPEVISDATPFLADYPANYASACGIRYVWHELRSAGSSGIGAARCKRCMVSKGAQ